MIKNDNKKVKMMFESETKILNKKDFDKNELKSFYWTRLKQSVKETITSSTIHAIPNIFRTDLIILKVMWFICFICASGGCLYLNVDAILNYLKHDVITQIRLVNEIPSEFPAITFCSLNSLTTQNASEYFRNTRIRLIKELSMANLNPFILSSLEFSRFWITMQSKNPNLTDEFRQSLGYTLNETMLQCSYGIGQYNQK